ncbi:hypothetical protein ACLOJK_026761 [Asimina triloba]
MQRLSFLPLDHLHLHLSPSGHPPFSSFLSRPRYSQALRLSVFVSPSRSLSFQSYAISLSELYPSLSIPPSFYLTVPSFDLFVSKPHDAAFKRLTTTTRRRVASFASKVIGALPVTGLFVKIISDEGILFMCCYAIGWLLLVLVL